MRTILTTQGILPLNGGLARSVPLLANALAEQGVDVHLVAPGYGASLSSMLLPAPSVHCHILPQKLLRSFPNAWQGRFLTWLWRSSFTETIQRLLNGDGSVVIHDNGIWLPSNHWAAVTARKMKVPLMISSRGMLSGWSLRHRGWRKQLAWVGYQRKDLATAEVIHATSAAEANDIRDAQMRQPIAVIPNGVELPPAPNPQLPTSNSDLRTLLFLSRIHPKKGLRMLADAWASIQKSKVSGQESVVGGQPKWRVAVAGFDEGGHQQELQQYIRKLGIESSFEFKGPVQGDEKWLLFRNADAFVLPSYSENFGISVAEALASGLPVITTQATPWSEIKARKCGWWVNADQKSLEEALLEMMRLNDDERREMGMRGRQLVKERFAWTVIARQMRDVYSWMLNQGGKPDCVITD